MNVYFRLFIKLKAWIISYKPIGLHLLKQFFILGVVFNIAILVTLTVSQTSVYAANKGTTTLKLTTKTTNLPIFQSAMLPTYKTSAYKPHYRPTPPQPINLVNPAQQEEPEESGEVVINEVKLIDTIFKIIAYIWLGIGVMLLLIVLVIFPILQIRGHLLQRDD